MINKAWMEKCINAGELLYGEFPMSVFHQLYATKAEPVDTSTVMEYYDESLMMLCDGEMFTPLIATEGELLRIFKDADAAGNPYASLHFDLTELKALRKTQADVKEFYIPTASEIDELVDNGYIRSAAMTALEKEIWRRGGEDVSFLEEIWPQVSSGKLDMQDSVSAVMKSAEEAGIKFASVDEANEFLKYVMPFCNNINLRERRGWPPEKLFRKQYPHGMTSMPTIMPGSAHMAQMMKQMEPQLKAMGAGVDYSSIDTFATVGQYGERRVMRVGRNDPCPCGSGKKYKQCHGRNV